MPKHVNTWCCFATQHLSHTAENKENTTANIRDWQQYNTTLSKSLMQQPVIMQYLVPSIVLITLVNTHFCAKKVSMVLGYFDVAESENGIGFSELALVFETFHTFVSKKC